MRKYSPLDESHPLVGKPCAACGRAFVVGDVVTLVALGPGDDPEAQARAREGRAYNAVGQPVHWSCATGEVEP